MTGSNSSRQDLAKTIRVERRTAVGLSVALVVAAIFFAIEMVWYSGFIERLGEFQFGRIDRYFPGLTVIAIVGLIGLLLIIVLRLIYKSRNTALGTAPLAGIELRLRNLGVVFLILAAISLGAAAIGAVLLLWSSPTSTSNRLIAVGSQEAAFPQDGPATLTGIIDYRLTAQLRERRLLFFQRQQAYAPITAKGGSNGRYDYFVTVPFGNAQPKQALVQSTGYLKKGALPPEIAQLYRDTGHVVGDNAYVLLGSRADGEWRSWYNIIELAIFGLVNLLFGLFQRRHANKIRPLAHGALL